MSQSSSSTLALRIGVALAGGTILGLILGDSAEPLGDVALVIIQILKAMAAPLVFLAVTEACSRVHLAWRQGVRLLSISLLNATVAGTIAITLDALIPMNTGAAESLREALLGGKAPEEKPAALTFSSVIAGLIPKSMVAPFLNNEVIGAVLLALFFGLALRKGKDAAEGEVRAQLDMLDSFVSGALRLMMTGIGWIIQVVPLAVFGVVAKVVGHSGFKSVSLLGFFLLVVTAGFLVQGVVYYALLLRLAGKKPLQFYRQAAEALMTAMGTGSSLATLPVTLRTLQEKMNVRPANARLAAMVGTNLNHDGILLYEAAAALFVARLLGVPMGPEDKVQLVAVSALAAFGIGGIPDAGLISLSLVLSTVRLPLTAVPLLLPLDWLIGRMRATLNVTSDLVVANLLESVDRKPATEAIRTDAAS